MWKTHPGLKLEITTSETIEGLLVLEEDDLAVHGETQGPATTGHAHLGGTDLDHFSLAILGPNVDITTGTTDPNYESELSNLGKGGVPVGFVEVLAQVAALFEHVCHVCLLGLDSL